MIDGLRRDEKLTIERLLRGYQDVGESEWQKLLTMALKAAIFCFLAAVREAPTK